MQFNESNSGTNGNCVTARKLTPFNVSFKDVFKMQKCSFQNATIILSFLGFEIDLDFVFN